MLITYRATRQDVAQDTERNYAAAKQSQFRPSNQLMLRSLHFLCDILSSHPVETLLRANFGIQRHFTIYQGQGPRRPLRGRLMVPLNVS